MKEETKTTTGHLIASALAALLIGGVFFVFAIAAGYIAAYLAPDRPGAVLLSGLVAGVAGVWALGWVFKDRSPRI